MHSDCLQISYRYLKPEVPHFGNCCPSDQPIVVEYSLHIILYYYRPIGWTAITQVTSMRGTCGVRVRWGGTVSLCKLSTCQLANASKSLAGCVNLKLNSPSLASG